MDDIIKIVKSLEKSGLLIDGISNTAEDESQTRFLGMLSATLGASILGNMLIGKGAMKAGRRYNNIDENFSAPSFDQY